MSTKDPTSLSFARDVRPMFTETDIEHMQGFGMNLGNKDDVTEHADAIYAAVSDGSMPPDYSGEEPWTQEMCQRFKRWQEQGCPP